MKLLVSCIVPVFNGERYLDEALDSILAQTHRPLEIIVADDGSTDGTATVAAHYGERVTYLWQSNAGPAAALNLGLQAAQGEFVTFLAADDLWHPEKVARQVTRLHDRPELDLCVTHLQNFWVPELADEAERFRGHRISQTLQGYTAATLLARREVFEKVGMFNAAMQHTFSTDWFLRAADQGIIWELLPDVLVYRRLHQANRSRLRADASRDEYLQLIKTSINRRRVREG